MYKLIVLAPSCGGKSTLMRYLREYSNLHVFETDKEVMKANNNIWPDDDLKNNVLIPKTTKKLLELNKIVYFASYIPIELLKSAKLNGFKIVYLDVPENILLKRNKKRMKSEGYNDVSQWFKRQLENFNSLKEEKIIDEEIDGNQSIEQCAIEIIDLTNNLF